jgi:hypothetical protein
VIDDLNTISYKDWNRLKIFCRAQYRTTLLTQLSKYEKENKLLPENQDNAYNEFYKSARYNKILEPNTTLMIHLATAIAIGCYP